MNSRVTSVGISIFVALTVLTQPVLAQQARDKGRERIGIYDSRAIAVAYAGSAFQTKKLKDLTGQLKKARDAGDTKEVSRLEAEGKAWQATLHQQGFSTAPVDDLLAHLASELPKIQETAGVTRLISKWNKPELKKHTNAEQVDVTMQLIDAFHPNERQRKSAIQIQKHEPQRLKE